MVSSHLLRKTQCSSCRSWLVTDVVAKELKSRLLCRRQNSLAGHGRQQSGSTLLILKPFSVHRPTLERVERHSRKALKKSRNPAESSGTLWWPGRVWLLPANGVSINQAHMASNWSHSLSNHHSIIASCSSRSGERFRPSRKKTVLVVLKLSGQASSHRQHTTTSPEAHPVISCIAAIASRHKMDTSIRHGLLEPSP